MEVKEALLKRRSVRRFTDEEVDNEMIDQLMHAGMSGPSAVNRQPWEFYAVVNSEKLKQLKSASLYTGYDAPLAIIVCGNKKRMLPLKAADFWIQDCSAATQNILLQAVELGLGTVWCGIYPKKEAIKKVSEILDLPDRLIPLNIIFVGHPAQVVEAKDYYKKEYVHII